jgi:hypothetical protein
MPHLSLWCSNMRILFILKDDFLLSPGMKIIQRCTNPRCQVTWGLCFLHWRQIFVDIVMEQALYHLSGPCNFDVASKFLERMCTPRLNHPTVRCTSILSTLLRMYPKYIYEIPQRLIIMVAVCMCTCVIMCLVKPSLLSSM